MRSFSEIIAEHKSGRCVGITSTCSAHPIVIEAALDHTRRRSTAWLKPAHYYRLTQA